jgi:hypothetical protein
LIFVKWIKYDGSDSSTHGASCSPNLLIGLNEYLLFFNSKLKIN